MRKKYALCVGINDYPGSVNDLHGCVNDAQDWSALLEREGYTVIQLLDGQATKQAVVNSLNHLVEQAGWADRIVFTYSGHGTWIPDTNGDEADGRDEAMCMYDFNAGGLLVDDDLANIFANLKVGSRALVLSDSCHSGTITRALNLSPYGTRFISPATFTDISPETAAAVEQKVAGAPRKAASLISGCGDTEYSYDASFDGRPNGAFTALAIKAYAPGMTLGQWYNAIKTYLPNTQYPQSPQLTATNYHAATRAL